ncbi:hypothetical protein H2198_002096 [Neophaeococcomyces mojaviensis]|uniref:Uncharacterized protein n=1 Tax=Neophaeococcomyces mojaviensis TaxID=3383035 RepID=A0ACC3AFI7_9EURO|nr:hypothetical protein H2198_002096 [Knufia sp. JES_112]
MNKPYSKPLHLYRALLREASYLFNPTLQDFHTEHIRWSFRRQLSPTKLSRHRAPAVSIPGLPTQYESQQLRRGRHYLYILQRANQGYRGALGNVLKMAYARKGKRRRALLREIMAPDPDASESSLSPASAFSEEWQPPAKFNMLLKKQRGIHTYLDRGGTIKPMPKIPAKNKSGKPFPQRRVKNIIKAWYAKHANLLLPPLSEEEWLKVYKTGTDGKENPRQATSARRPVATVSVFALPNTPGTREVTHFHDILTPSPQLTKPKVPNRIRKIIGNPHKMTPRFLRRIMLRTVIQNTPVILADTHSGKLASRWDAAGTKRYEPGKISESQKLLLFD